MPNPLFPLNEYVPDGEPHVFGNRVYLYGSHDEEKGDRFCTRDYTVYSAPVTDLTSWTCHGTSYRKNQDPRSTEEKPADLYAPDCVRGNDGKYYLYYVAMGPNVKNFGPISVAVSDRPEGPFSYLHDVSGPDGTPLLKYLTNDPAVLNDNGKIYLYYGWGLGRDFRGKLLTPLYRLVMNRLFKRSLSEIRETKPSIMSCAVVELCDDMYTVKAGPRAVLDSKTTAGMKSALYQHAFYEAPSIRKFGELYYLVYSSGENCELAYATSSYPDRGFTYRGVIISNADLGFDGNDRYHMTGGTIHGGIEYINGEYYVFYHRCTNNTDFSRQACAERIQIDETGYIRQVEMTTGGVDPDPLPAKGKWPAAACCSLYNRKTARVMGNGHNGDVPDIVSEGGQSFVTAIDRGTVIGYKYLRFDHVSQITATCRGAGGRLYIATDESELERLKSGNTKEGLKYVSVEKRNSWKSFSCAISIDKACAPLYFVYVGKGKMDFLEFEIG